MEKSAKANFDHADSFVFRNERPWPVPRLKRAAIVGHTTPVSSKIWIRTGELGDYKFIACPPNAVQNPIDKIGKTVTMDNAALNRILQRNTGSKMEDFRVDNFDDDTTHVVRLNDLSPDTLYRYMVLQRGPKEGGDEWRAIIGADKVGAGKVRRCGLSFRTLSDDQTRPFSFALFSCHNPFVEEGFFSDSTRVKAERMEAWAALAQTLHRHSRRDDKRLAFVIAGGDQMYTDGRPGIDIWEFLYKKMKAAKERGKQLPEEGTMLTWFRDIFRAYWGFPDVREVFANYPTYMIWDDHEIGDGWGSFDVPNDRRKNLRCHPIYKKADEIGLSHKQADELLHRMFNAAKEAYTEYEHSHNPDSLKKGEFYYKFTHGGCAFFVLDGRGHRDVNRPKYRIHGEVQMKEFAKFVGGLNPTEHKFLFVVSAVPVLHTAEWIVGLEKSGAFGAIRGGDRDDLRDGWEHSLHDVERREFKRILWQAAKKGIHIAILSGDVHASAAFRLEKKGIDLPIYQLTSSAITYHLTLVQEKFAKHLLPAAEEGKTQDGEYFTRLALSVKSPYTIVQVDPKTEKAVFQLYSVEQTPSHSDSSKMDLRTNSAQRIELW